MAIRVTTSNRIVIGTTNKMVGANEISFSVLTDKIRFPYCINSGNTGIVYFYFLAATTLSINWGNGTTSTINTYEDTDGLHKVVLYDKGATATTIIPVWWTSKITYASAISRLVTFNFDTELLRSIGLNSCQLQGGQQFVLRRCPNLSVMSLSTVGKSDGDLTGVFDGMRFSSFSPINVTNLGILNVILSTSPMYTVLPEEIFSCVNLTNLSIGGGYEVNSFSTSKFDRIGSTFSQLVSLSMSVQFTEAQGLPSNFNLLTSLKTFGMSNMTTSPAQFPSVLRAMGQLETLTANVCGSMTSVGNLSAMTSLKRLVVSNTRLANDFATTMPTGLANCVSLQELDFRGTFQSTAKVDSFINNLYTFINANADITGLLPKFRSLILRLENGSARVSGVPTGVYQMPTGYSAGVSNGSPATPLEVLWVFANQYGFTVTYRAT